MKLHEDDFFDEEEAEVLRFDNFDDAVECCTDLNIPFFVDAGNKKLVFCFVRVDDEGSPEIARCTEREFATILAGISHLSGVLRRNRRNFRYSEFVDF
ncbi:hypothetical protein LNZ58_003691 [Escherichia coli]|nr:hypothetical protein [Escherichia coli]EKR2566484.1 hypothetical protein [Escherichia coli]